ncbi:MAG: ATP-binding protein [Okeania sp. SIO3I5]|uniref:NACHT domain-containing protein n=1 Tax=Okeania sp. SIO3I5 TaxID=2607805 RepID=UPI0013BC46A7|nr:ATP-binding protein [Okeania sp. SIO3I5]NEQ34897.1 ATP-binding protein [Okeania sp. SIO3I5]
MLSVTEKEQKLLWGIFLTIAINIPIGITVNYISSDNKLLKNLFYIFLSIFLILVIFLLISWLIKFYKTKNTFRRLLTVRDKKVIDDYLDAVRREVESELGFELRFDPNSDYVSLSGEPGNPNGLMSQQAYEEKGGSQRTNIPNLDKYLLSPNESRVFIYGPPGSGKSTTLYKALANYTKEFSEKIGYFIPIFIHANDVEKVLNTHGKSIKKILEFITNIYEINDKLSQPEFKNFISLWNKKPSLNFVIIIDALDEFIDKSKREILFDYLSILMKDSVDKTRWILSCREEEYKAYANTLKVANVRIKPMSVSQVKELLNKRLKSFTHDPHNQNIIRNTIWTIIDTNAEQESFLRNPYYLSLWLFQVSFSPDLADAENRIPSIRNLHDLELKREILKGMNVNPPTRFEQIDNVLFQYLLEVLSILSFHLMRISLQVKHTSHYGVSISDHSILDSLYKKYKDLRTNRGNFDQETTQRLIQYKSYELSLDKIQEHKIAESDRKFIRILKVLNTSKWQNLRLRNQDRFDFFIVISSIIDIAEKYRLIELNSNFSYFSRFLNQRAADYLAARYFVENGLKGILQQTGEPNFWLFRTIAISIAISNEPDKILDPKVASKDPVLATAVVNGLSFVRADDKKLLSGFIRSFVGQLLDPKNFDSSYKEYDPCNPLRVLKFVSRLSSNGYSSFFWLPHDLFKKLLQNRDTSIADTAAITLLTHASRTEFDIKTWRILLRFLLIKSVRFEFPQKFDNGFSTAIYRGLIGDV